MRQNGLERDTNQLMGGVQGNREGRGKRRREIAVDDNRKEMADRVGRYQANY